MSNRKSRRGVEAIEFAMVIPVAILILSGIFDYGWYFHQEMVLTDAARHAARTASVSPQDADLVNAATSAFNTALAAGGQSSIDATLTIDTVDMSNGEQAVQVGATADYTGLWGMVAMPYELRAHVVMRREDQPN